MCVYIYSGDPEATLGNPNPKPLVSIRVRGSMICLVCSSCREFLNTHNDKHTELIQRLYIYMYIYIYIYICIYIYIYRVNPKSIILSLPPPHLQSLPYCKLLHDHCTIYAPPPSPLFMPYTIQYWR